jgi:hypothetical protein
MKLININLRELNFNFQIFKIKKERKTAWQVTSDLWKFLCRAGGYLAPNGDYSDRLSKNFSAKRGY